MKTRMILTSVALLMGGLVLLSMTYVQQKPKPWTVPANYQSKKNPVKADATSLADGKEAWAKHCKSCHGAKGLGDGTKAASLNTFPGDFTKPAFKSQADGALYYKTFVGRDEMPSFEKKITDETERWSLINYMKSL
jgi:mono/diheme cytochrome c family protein